ncbi:RHS repeat-associated core domain-containing protein [Sphingopyxis sp. P8]|uniref:RHS repeat-associated core domain-containing protein n=1 Tax=Sphingopyxis sp. P8 TaxID=2763256 RepID=UPI001D09E3F9|nr:RHS repeat-associated core domain-containing protein [Sphingopyxis sp. P8]
MTRTNDAYAWQAHYNVDRTYIADGLNRIMSAGGIGFSYDARGNLVNDGTNGFTYTAENLLKTGPAGATLGYDPLGRLYQTVGGGVTTRFQYDGIDLIAEYNASNAVQRRYVHGPGIDNAIVWYEGSGTGDRRFLMADERGSIVSITDSAGATIAINAYDEYGIPAPGNIGRFGYTGQTWLPEVGMWYYKARIYSPTLGRFLQTDPIGYADGMNWYAYVGGDPVNGVDPSGATGLAKWQWSCYGNCADGAGYWNTGIGGLGTPAQKEAGGWTRGSDGGWIPPPQNNGVEFLPSCSGAAENELLGSGPINCAFEASKWRRYRVRAGAAGSIATRKAARARYRSHFGVPPGFDRFCPLLRRQAAKYRHIPSSCLLALNKIASNLERVINGS